MQNFLALILFAASIWGFLGYIEPRYREVLDLKQEKAKYEEALDNAREVDIIRNKLMADYRGVADSDLERISKMIPDGVDNVRLVIDIDGIAKRHGMFLSGIKVEEGKNEKSSLPPGETQVPNSFGYNNLFLSFSVSGQYDNIKGFVKDLDRSLRAVDIETIAISSKKEEEKIGSDLSASIRLVTYWLKK